MKKRIIHTLVSAVLLVSVVFSTACKKDTPKDDGISAKMLIGGFVNLATDNNDPYKKWIKDNFGLNVNLVAVGDISGASVTQFASNEKPDIVVFDNLDEYNTISEQNVLLEDWTPYLAKMPNAKKIVEQKDADNPNDDSVARKMMTENGKLRAIWTLPDSPTWSLKIREDWAREYRATTTGGTTSDGLSYPAGKTATDGGEWQPKTPEDLISFARWIKATKKNCYAFTSAGGQSSLGTLGNWLPLMWGTVAEMPYGAFVNENGQVDFPVVNGTHKYYIDFLKQIVSEGYIDPAWYTQTWENKTKTKQGYIGIEWYPGAISTETQAFHEDEDTTDWWKTYSLPCAKGFDAGYMPVEGYVGNIICVSKRAAIDAKKMDAICKFIDSCLVYYDESSDSFVRPAGYNALRWGVGVESGYEYRDIEGSNYKYINTKDADGKKFYRNTTVGAGSWDWGAWIATSKDGIVQGNKAEVDALTKKVVEHNSITASMKTKTQIGSSLNLDGSMIKALNTQQIRWEYNYVIGEKVMSYDNFVRQWKTAWGGDELMKEAERQFAKLGLI